MPTVYLLCCKDCLGHIQNIGVYCTIEQANMGFMNHLKDNLGHYGHGKTKLSEIDEICLDTWVLCGVHYIEELFFIC